MRTKPIRSTGAGNSTVQALPFIVFLPLVGDRPSLDFVNTIAWRLCPDKNQDSLLAYSDLLAFSLRLDLISVEIYSALCSLAEHSPGAAEQAFSDARSFREAYTAILDDLFGTPGKPSPAMPPQQALVLFDSFRRRARESETLIWKGSRIILASRSEKEGLDLPVFLLVRDADELLRSPGAAHVRICAAEGCGWAFLDGSKNGGRRWCSMQRCGNREKATRFRTRL